MLQLQHHWPAPVTLVTADLTAVRRLPLSHAPPPQPPSRLWYCHCITILHGYALLIYLTVPLCLCILCCHPSQPGVSCWLTCESTPLASWALAAIVMISRYRCGLCHDIAILKKVHDLSPSKKRQRKCGRTGNMWEYKMRDLIATTARRHEIPHDKWSHITQCYLPPDRGDSHAFIPSVLPVLIYRPRKDERPSWPRWLVILRWFTRRWSPIQVLPGPDIE